MLVVSELRELIKTTLMPMSLYSAQAEELLMATCAQESLLGTYRHQLNGPAIGIFQMEPGDFDDIWVDYLNYRQKLHDAVAALASNTPPVASDMQNNDPFAIAMCRVHYERCPRALPAATDLNAIWMYYKVNYNSIHGAATQGQFYSNYHRLVGGAAQ